MKFGRAYYFVIFSLMLSGHMFCLPQVVEWLRSPLGAGEMEKLYTALRADEDGAVHRWGAVKLTLCKNEGCDTSFVVCDVASCQDINDVLPLPVVCFENIALNREGFYLGRDGVCYTRDGDTLAPLHQPRSRKAWCFWSECIEANKRRIAEDMLLIRAYKE